MTTDANLAGARPFPPRSVKDGPAVLLHHPRPPWDPAVRRRRVASRAPTTNGRPATRRRQTRAPGGPLLKTLLLLPLTGALLIALVPPRVMGLVRPTAIAVSAATLAWSLWLTSAFDPARAGVS